MDPNEIEEKKPDSNDLPLLDHLEELRQRLIRVFATILIFSIVAYIFSDKLVDILVKPVGTAYFREPTGAFMVRIKMAAFCGIVASVPVILYHFWKFVVPGLYERESKYLFPIIIFGTLFFFGGAAFCFFLVMPIAMTFLTEYGTETLKPLIDIKEYFSFVFWLCLAFGAVFELPIIAFFLGKLGIINSRFLAKGRRYAVVLILVLGMVLTPPDMFSQLMLAIPLYLLYEISIIVVKLTGRREKREDETQSTRVE
jgi:sec-independent protein translocase protein TatC